MSDSDAALRQVSRLVGRGGAAEWELDLTGLDLAHARASVERMVERSRFASGKAVIVRLDPATPTSGETLFQPIGRLLLELLKRGLLTRLSPLGTEQGAGFYLELTGRREATTDGDGAAEDGSVGDGAVED